MTVPPTVEAVTNAYAPRLYPEAQRDWKEIVAAIPGEHDPGVRPGGMCCAGCEATDHYEAAVRAAAAGKSSSAQWHQAVGDAWYQRARFLREELAQREVEAER